MIGHPVEVSSDPLLSRRRRAPRLVRPVVRPKVRPKVRPMVRTVAVVVVAVLASGLASCGDERGSDAAGTGSPGSDGATDLVVTPANYELVAGTPQRVIAGVQSNSDARLLGYGTVPMTFTYLGTRDDPVKDAEPSMEAEARFLPIPGQSVAEGAEPRLVAPSEAIGVYGAEVTFDRPGFWNIGVTVTIDGEERHATGAVEVRAEARIPAPGEPAPRTDNPVLGTEGVDPAAIDSRAAVGGVPDEILHRTSVAGAIAAGRPVMVVISTPVYCQSRFCGPITDSVQGLAERYGDRMAFVHIEVWADFEEKVVNPAALEWISAPGGDTNEPWVFVVDSNGIIVERFDNVATDAELEAAVESVLA